MEFEITKIGDEENASRVRLTGMESTIDALVTMSEGNPGGLTVLTDLLGGEDMIMGMAYVFWLDEMDMRGAQIWVAYKDWAGQDIKVLRKGIADNSGEMVKCVNESGGLGPDTPKARVRTS